MGKKQKKILLVSDDRSMGELALYILRKAGYEAVVTGTEEQATDEEPSWDLIIVDEGGALRSADWQKKSDREAPLLVLLGRGEEGSGTVGASRIPKPFTAKMLLRTVKKCLDVKR